MDPNLAKVFAGQKDAKTTERGNPQTAIEEKQPDGTIKHTSAEYDLEIQKVVCFQAREGYNAFIVTFKVLASTNPNVKVGDTSRTWFQRMDKDSALGAVKSFLLAVIGIGAGDTEKINEVAPEMNQMIDDVLSKQAFTGQKVRVRVDRTITKKNQPFNRHTFLPYPEAA